MAMNAKLPPLLVRADADGARGIGHVMRSLALARAWVGQGGGVDFITARPTALLRQRIELSGARVIDMERGCPDPVDVETSGAALARLRRDGDAPPWLIVDGYHFTPAYHSAIRRSGCRLLVIDDTAHLERYDADIVLNHGVHAPRLEYSASGDTWLLLGTRYALLRAEFERWREFQRTIAKSAKNILLTLGGADNDNVTAQAIDALGSLNDIDLNVKILAGPLNGHWDDLCRRAAAAGNMSIHTDVADLAPMMAWADIAIAAGGTTAWELAFMQTPALLLVLAENQIGVAAGCAEFGAAEKISVGEIADRLRRLIDDPQRRRRMAERGRILVDGDGPARVLAAIRERQRFNCDRELTIRRADNGDQLLLWQWANDPATRRNSFSSEAIGWDDHQAWCARKFADPGCRFWIMQMGELPVAQIRYDRMTAGSTAAAEISFSVAPGFRGMELGTRLLAATAPLAARELAVDHTQGFALQSNEASLRAFLKAGFTAAEDLIVGGRLCTLFRRDGRTVSRRDDHVTAY